MPFPNIPPSWAARMSPLTPKPVSFTAPNSAPVAPPQPLGTGNRSEILAHLLQQPRGPAPLSTGEAIVGGLSKGLEGWALGNKMAADEKKKKDRGTMMARALFGGKVPEDDPKFVGMATLLAEGDYAPSSELVENAFGLSTKDPIKVGPNDTILDPDTYEPLWEATPDAATPYTDRAKLHADFTAGLISQEDYIAGLEQLNASEGPTPYTDAAKIAADLEANLITPEQAQAAYDQLEMTEEGTPSPLGRLIEERNALFTTNPNDPNLALYDQRIAREATGDKGWSIETNPDGTISMSQGAAGDASAAEGIARSKQIPKMFGAIADDLPAADSFYQSVGQLSQLLETTDTGAVPALLESIRKTTGIAIGEQADKRQAVESLVDYLTPRMRVPGSGATSDMEMRTFKNSLPTLMGTPGGNQIIIQTLTALGERRIRMAQIAQDYTVGLMSSQEAIEAMRSLPDAFGAFKEAQAQGLPQAPIAPEQESQGLPPGTYDWTPDGLRPAQ